MWTSLQEILKTAYLAAEKERLHFFYQIVQRYFMLPWNFTSVSFLSFLVFSCVTSNEIQIYAPCTHTLAGCDYYLTIDDN